jgi:hypothetical protein
MRAAELVTDSRKHPQSCIACSSLHAFLLVRQAPSPGVR